MVRREVLVKMYPAGLLPSIWRIRLTNLVCNTRLLFLLSATHPLMKLAACILPTLPTKQLALPTLPATLKLTTSLSAELAVQEEWARHPSPPPAVLLLSKRPPLHKFS